MYKHNSINNIIVRRTYEKAENPQFRTVGEISKRKE
jgi:hypothetical protein